MLSFDAEINRSLWPWQIACLAAALGAVGLAATRHRLAGRAIGAILVGAWLACGLVFHLHYFAALSFTAPAFGVLFLVQAALLAWSLVLRGGIRFAVGRGAPAWFGFLCIATALVLLPLLAGLGEGWASARLFALAPGPTAVFTLGLLLMTVGRQPLHLLVLPFVWTLIAGATAWELGITADLLQPVLGSAALALALAHNRRMARRPA